MKNISTLNYFFLILFVQLIIGCDNYENVKVTNTVEAYSKYLIENPETNHRQEILLRIQKLEFEKAISKNDLSKMELYLQKYPSNTWSDSIITLIRNLKFEAIKPILEVHKNRIQEAKLYPLELKFEYFANLSSYLAIDAFNKRKAIKAIKNSNSHSAKEISTLLISHNEFFLKTYSQFDKKENSMRNTFDSLNVLFSFERSNIAWKSLREKELIKTLEMFFCQSDTCFERTKSYLFKDEVSIKKLLK
ncbi:MAG: hypothetical protein DWQ06_01825 [Calditrichaeota bacterium]|nr:MAG: hypothetical protein DWQ06_01825 [Calditrichota bacterium]